MPESRPALDIALCRLTPPTHLYVLLLLIRLAVGGRRGASGGFYFDSCSDVQNVGASTTDITSAYFYRSGRQVPNAGRTERNVLPGAVAMFYVPAESQGDFLGSVRITCSNSVPIAGIHNVARLRNSAGDPTPGDFAAGYNLVQR